MMLWLLLALMTAAASFAVLWPLARRAPASAGTEVAVYRDQLNELERDRAAGLIGDAELDAARIEISRRLLASAQDNPKPLFSPTRRRRAVAIVALVALPVGAVSLYLAFGSPSVPGQPLAARVTAPGANASIDTLVAQVEARLAQAPDDARGWEVIAPVYLRLGRFEEAAQAWRNVIAHGGDSAAREAGLAEALIAAANGVVTVEAKAAVERALTLDAGEVKARFFHGLAAEQDGRADEAAATWRALLAGAPPDAAWAECVRTALQRVDAQAQATPAMIRGMVERLAERMQRDGSNADGWSRLVRSYMVLGERDKALATAQDARRALAADPDKLRAFDAFVKDLGLEG